MKLFPMLIKGFIILFMITASSVQAQSLKKFLSSAKQSSLPYETPNEFPNLSEFETVDDYFKVGFQTLSIDEIKSFIDPNFNEYFEDYVFVTKLSLNSRLGLIFYHVLYESESEIFTYQYILIIYSDSGKQLSRFDLLAYEWITNLEETSEEASEESLEEQELFREMQEDYKEIEKAAMNDENELDTLRNVITEETVDLNNVDEGYAFSTIYIKNGSVFIRRKSTSYYNGQWPGGITFKLNESTNEFEEIME